MAIPDDAWDSVELIYIATALSRRTEARAVPAMLEAVSICVPLRARLGPELDSRLEAMDETEAAAWDATGERLLLRWLTVAVKETAGRRRFRSILHALELVGTEPAVLPVGDLTEHGDPDIRVAAKRCYQIVAARVAIRRQGRDLLRAGSAPKSPAAELLRAGAQRAETPASELMRPHR
jgi:hypothetical protein